LSSYYDEVLLAGVNTRTYGISDSPYDILNKYFKRISYSYQTFTMASTKPLYQNSGLGRPKKYYDAMTLVVTGTDTSSC
jgi:hypothetical protein